MTVRVGIALPDTTPTPARWSMCLAGTTLSDLLDAALRAERTRREQAEHVAVLGEQFDRLADAQRTRVVDQIVAVLPGRQPTAVGNTLTGTPGSVPAMSGPGGGQRDWGEVPDDAPTPPYGLSPAAAVPPRGHRRLTVVLAAVALAAIVGGGIAVLVTARSQPPPATLAPPAGPAPPGAGIPPSFPAAPPAPRHAGWHVVVSQEGRLAYEVPPDWNPAPEGTVGDEQLGVALGDVARVGDYRCDGQPYSRGLVGSVAVAPGSDSLAEVARRLAEGFAVSLYATPDGPPAQVQAEAVSSVRRDDLRYATVAARVSSSSDGSCLATEGMVQVLALDAGSAVVALVVNGDTAGGPASPPPPSADVLREILGSARLLS